jgi:hypothetical protein
MPAFVATLDSVRERILVELRRLYDSQLKNVNDHPFAWEIVIRSPLLDGNRRKNYELAIIDRGELKEIQIGTQNATLEIDLEWSSLLGRDDEPSIRANEIILSLERRLNENVSVFAGGDDTGQQLALRAWTIGNEWNADNDTDRRIEGVMFVRVLYKHGVADPREQIQ